MPTLNISSSSEYHKTTINDAIQKASGVVAAGYGCDLKYVWSHWQHLENSTWFYRSKLYTNNELEFINFELSLFRDKSKASVSELLVGISEMLKTSFPDATIYGRFTELSADEVIYNDKLLADGI